MRRSDLCSDGEAKPCPALARLGAALKRLQEALFLPRWNPDPAIAHRDRGRRFDCNFHRRSVWRKPEGILDQVRDSKPQRGTVTANGESDPDQFQLGPLPYGERSKPGYGVRSDGTQIDVLCHIKRQTFQPRHAQKLADKAAHSIGIMAESGYIRRVRQTVQPSRQDGERRAQTVGGLSHEAPLHGDRSFKPCQCLVHGIDQGNDLDRQICGRQATPGFGRANGSGRGGGARQRAKAASDGQDADGKHQEPDRQQQPHGGAKEVRGKGINHRLGLVSALNDEDEPSLCPTTQADHAVRVVWHRGQAEHAAGQRIRHERKEAGGLRGVGRCDEPAGRTKDKEYRIAIGGSEAVDDRLWHGNGRIGISAGWRQVANDEIGLRLESGIVEIVQRGVAAPCDGGGRKKDGADQNRGESPRKASGEGPVPGPGAISGHDTSARR